MQSSDKDFLRFVDDEINQSSKFQSIIINILIKICNLVKSNKLLHDKLYSVNYSLWNFPSKNLNSKINCFKKKIKNEIIIRDKRFSLFKSEIKEKIYQDYFNYEKLTCQKLPFVIRNEKIMKNIIDKFENYKFPYDILTYDTNRNFLDPRFEKTIILDHSEKNQFFEDQIDLIKKLI